MEVLSEVLPIVIYFLLVVLLVVVIILTIKLIGTIGKVDKLIDDVQDKVSSLDKVFTIFDLVTNKFSIVTDTVIGFASNLVKKIFKKKENDEDE